MQQAHNETFKSKRKYTCEVCTKIFLTAPKLKAHLLFHSGDYEYACTHCEVVYSNFCRFRSHMNKLHDEIVTCKDDSLRFTCTQCPMEFTLEHDFKMHLRYHSSDYKYACKYCKQAYDGNHCLSRDAYRSHMKELHNEIVTVNTNCKTYTCTQCSKDFPRAGELKVHLQYHSGKYKYACDSCEKGYVGRTAVSHYKTHMKKLHDTVDDDDEDTVVTQSKEYTCKQCPSKPLSANDMKLHLQYHSDDFKYACNTCQIAFDGNCAAYLYSSHMKTLHGEIVTCNPEYRVIPR